VTRLLILAVAAAVAICASGCDGVVVVISTGPSSVAGVRAQGGTIPIGTPVNGMLTARGGAVAYQVTAPRSGTLALGVNWDKSQGPVDVRFGGDTLPRPLSSPPLTGRFPVQARQVYIVEVADAAPSAGGTLNLPFTVTAAIE
jgi:hypothetical protein